MPNRFIKESICTSDTIDKLNSFEEVFFYRLIVSVDDFGRFDARPPILRSRLFPLKDLTDEVIAKALLKLQEVGLIEVYTVNGKRYLQIETWSQHQQTRATQSKYPGIEQRDTGTGDSFASRRGTAKTPADREIVSHHEVQPKHLPQEEIVSRCYGNAKTPLVEEEIVSLRSADKTTDNEQEIVSLRRSAAKTTEKNALITNDNKCYQMISSDNGCKQMISNALVNENENVFENDNDTRSLGACAREEDGFFAEFWDAYPKKFDIESARIAFAHIHPTRELLDRILAALDKAKSNEQWQQEDGRFIPNPAKWLKGERWNEVSLATSEPQGSFDTKEFFDLAMQRSFK